MEHYFKDKIFCHYVCGTKGKENELRYKKASRLCAICHMIQALYTYVSYLLTFLSVSRQSTLASLKVHEPFFHRELVRYCTKTVDLPTLYCSSHTPILYRIALGTLLSGKVNFILFNFIPIRVKISSKKSLLSSKKKSAMAKDVQPMSTAVLGQFA